MSQTFSEEQRSDFLCYSRALFAEKYGDQSEKLQIEIKKALDFSGVRLSEREGAYVQRFFAHLSDQEIGKHLWIPSEIITHYRLRHNLLKDHEWSTERIRLYLRVLQNRHWILTPETLEKWHPNLLTAITSRFENTSAALRAANVSPEAHLDLFHTIQNRFPDPESVLPVMKRLCAQSSFPTYGYLLKADEILLRAVLFHWGSVTTAGFAAGIQVGKLDRRIAQLQGDYCEALIKEALKQIGRSLKYVPQGKLHPDAYDESTNRFIEVKLSLHNTGIEKTLETYQKELGAFELWYLRENEAFLGQLKERFPKIDFFSVHAIFPDLLRLGREDLVAELRSLDRNEMTPDFLRYLPRHSSAESYERIQSVVKEHGVIGGHKPDFLCQFREGKVEVKLNESKAPREMNIFWKKESYRSYLQKALEPLLHEICHHNEEWLRSESPSFDPVLIDLEKLIAQLGFSGEKANRKYIQYNTLAYKLTFSIYGRVYYLRKFRKPREARFTSATNTFTRSEILAKMRDYLGQEPQNSISDAKLRDWLLTLGIDISRRTVNKYRHLLKKEAESVKSGE